MLLTGNYKFTHVVREFFLCEYAFELDFHESLIRIAHNKGTWMLWKQCKRSGNVDAFEINDALGFTNTIFSPADGLIQGFLIARLGAKMRNNKVDAGVKAVSHGDIADVLSDFLWFWCGKDKRLNGIEVVQPGRNARLSEQGDFCLIPSESEWK